MHSRAGSNGSKLQIHELLINHKLECPDADTGVMSGGNMTDCGSSTCLQDYPLLPTDGLGRKLCTCLGNFVQLRRVQEQEPQGVGTSPQTHPWESMPRYVTFDKEVLMVPWSAQVFQVVGQAGDGGGRRAANRH